MDDFSIKDTHFKKIRHGICVALWLANQHLENFQEIQTTLGQGQINKTRQFYHFLLFSEMAFYQCFVNNIFNSIHKHSKSNNIYRLCNYAIDESAFSETLKEQINECFIEIQKLEKEDTFRKIDKDRNKVISHNEIVNQGFAPSLTYVEAKHFLDRIIKIFEKISLAYDGQGNTYDLPFLHAMRLLDYLKNQPIGEA